MKYEFVKWNEEKDILVINSEPLLQTKHPVVSDNSPWAYSLNTAIGFYHKSKNKAFLDDEDLLLTTEEGTEQLYCNVSVWPHHYYSKFMLVTLHDTMQTILIDSRGIPFEINCEYSNYCYGRKVVNDKEKGCFVIDNSFSIKYRSVKEQEEFEGKSRAISGATFNKEFNRFVRENARNSLPYLYLTAGHSKCGIFIDYFITNGMEYEIVPNMLCDDKSINIRVPLHERNLAREDVQYLCAKYENTYAIYNVPIKVAGGMFTPVSRFFTFIPAEKECLACSIYNTFCCVFGTIDKGKIFQKTISKVLRLFDKSSYIEISNKFTNLLLLHPKDIKFNDSYFESKRNYIAKILSIDSCAVTLERYYEAYVISKQKYREEILVFESEIQQLIASTGRPISRWKNESHLYELTVQAYPDAIYQYHSIWLGRQSLDIFIPSLSVGIEYQGEQHYRPIDFFGGNESFESTIKRDQRKAKICKDNGVKLIYWGYDEIITLGRIKEKIEAVITM